MRIAIIVEGKTEKVFIGSLRNFLESRLAGRMPKLDTVPQDGEIPSGEKLKKLVERLLSDRSRRADAVIALTDVYTGKRRFTDAGDAKRKLREWVGDNAKFHAHAAQFDFEAWLLPYWSDIQALAKSTKAPPRSNPETINHERPPSILLKEVFRQGDARREYNKIRDAARILQGKDLEIAARSCPELRDLLNTILQLCGGRPLTD